MKLLVISYTIKVHCARSYREWNPEEIIQEIEKDIPQTFAIAEDDPEFIQLKEFYGDKPFDEGDLFDLLVDYAECGHYSELYNCFFEDDRCIGEIMTKTVESPKITSFKVIEIGGLL